MRIKIVANNCDWVSWPQKTKALADWYQPKVDLEFSITHTVLENVPFTTYEDGREGVDAEWYDKYITPMGIGYDIVMLVLPVKEWQSRKARGWRTDSDQGPVQLQVACDENEEIIWPNFPSMSSFFQIARHEIMHALYMISGQYDVTHFWWDRGQFEYARDSLKIPQYYSIPIIQRALNFLSFLFAKSQKTIMDTIPTPPVANRELLYKVAKECIGTDVSPKDIAPDELACMETVDSIVFKATGRYINPKRKSPQVSTYLGYADFRTSPDWIEVADPLPGDVVICATGYGGQNGITHGHVGIIGENGVIMSNQSIGLKKGQFLENYTLETWRARYEKLGGYPVRFYRRS